MTHARAGTVPSRAARDSSRPPTTHVLPSPVPPAPVLRAPVPPILVVAPCTEVLDVLGHLSLSVDEEARAARMVRAEDAADFRAAHLLARRALALATGTEDGELVPVQSCAGCGGPHGRPRVPGHPDVHLAWAHTRGSVAVVVAGVPCGVDVERSDGRPVPPRVVDRTLTADEAALVRSSSRPRLAFLEAWGVKESLVKAGEGDLAAQHVRAVVGPVGLRAPGEADHVTARIRVRTGPARVLDALVRIDHDPGVSTVALLLGGDVGPERVDLTTGLPVTSHVTTPEPSDRP